MKRRDERTYPGGGNGIPSDEQSLPLFLMNICNSDEWMKGVITIDGTSRHLIHARMYPINRYNLSSVSANNRSNIATFRPQLHTVPKLVNTYISNPNRHITIYLDIEAYLKRALRGPN